jgi:vacuolar protein sorting-associated protein 13A/C
VQETQNHLELWKPKAVLKDAHWFLNDTLEDEWMEILVENALDTMVDDVLSAGDHLSLTTDSIVIVFETSFGTRTVPMLLLEAKFNCTVEDFSRKMHCVGNMQLEVAYYNDLFDVWEPLLEPVEDVKSYRSWQAQVRQTEKMII